MKFVAYYRVSTDRQGKSGLGLDAQREAVLSFATSRGGVVVEEFTEIESGKRNDRPQLAAALAVAKAQGATLAIAKLDRLARNVAFIANLMEGGADFVAVDMPQANRLTLHILAAVAEHEREMISKRTREALKAAKARGVRLGNPDPLPAQRLGSAANQVRADEFRATVRPLVLQLRRSGLSYRQIANELNRRAVRSAHAKQWYAAQVRAVLLMDSPTDQVAPVKNSVTA